MVTNGTSHANVTYQVAQKLCSYPDDALLSLLASTEKDGGGWLVAVARTWSMARAQ